MQNCTKYTTHYLLEISMCTKLTWIRIKIRERFE